VPRANGVSEARVTVFDANNRVLRQETLSLTGGDATWRWNGRDSNGTVMPDGAYRVAVQGTPTGGAARPLPFTVAGRVTGLEPQQGNMALALGSLTVPLDRVRTVQSTPR
jgi:flagellar basal-body rod modification protein FlgD